VVADYAVKANSQFKGKHAMEIMDAVVAALAEAHIMVILDNHVSRADWCCSETDGNGLWYSAEYPESRWLADWQTMVRRYQHQRWVVGQTCAMNCEPAQPGVVQTPSSTGMQRPSAAAMRSSPQIHDSW
jgi:endoglucanase